MQITPNEFNKTKSSQKKKRKKRERRGEGGGVLVGLGGRRKSRDFQETFNMFGQACLEKKSTLQEGKFPGNY